GGPRRLPRPSADRRRAAKSRERAARPDLRVAGRSVAGGVQAAHEAAAAARRAAPLGGLPRRAVAHAARRRGLEAAHRQAGGGAEGGGAGSRRRDGAGRAARGGGGAAGGAAVAVKLRSLNLERFGHFQGASLELAGGLNLLFGHNE